MKTTTWEYERFVFDKRWWSQMRFLVNRTRSSWSLLLHICVPVSYITRFWAMKVNVIGQRQRIVRLTYCSTIAWCWRNLLCFTLAEFLGNRRIMTMRAVSKRPWWQVCWTSLMYFNSFYLRLVSSQYFQWTITLWQQLSAQKSDAPFQWVSTGGLGEACLSAGRYLPEPWRYWEQHGHWACTTQH